jgi:hypothetical protein
MELTPWLAAVVLSALFSFLAVQFIPRSRQSPVFDLVLWGATWLLAFLGTQSAPNYIPANSPLNDYVIAGIHWVPMLIGAVIGALSINGLLWVIDRFSQPLIEDELESTGLEEENGGADSEPPAKQ